MDSMPMGPNLRETQSVFSRMVKGVSSAWKDGSRVSRFIKNKFERKDPFLNAKRFNKLTTAKVTKKMNKMATAARRRTASRLTLPRAGGFTRFGGYALGLAVGAVAMVGVGMMKGAQSASTELVAQRQMQDQRYARNITMMSRLGYTTGTSSMNKYNHTMGLSQALSANRHGRGGY